MSARPLPTGPVASYPVAHPPAGAAPVTRPERSPRRGRAVVAVVAVLVVLGLVGGAGAALLLTESDETAAPSDSARRAPSAGAGESLEPSSSVATSSVPDPTPSSDPTPTPEPPAFVCWNGTGVDVASRCPAPSGFPGLAWVYPSLHRRDCYPVVLSARPTVWQCPQTTAGGDTVLIRYNEWASADLGWASYLDKGRESSLELVRSSSGRVVKGVFRYDGVNDAGRVTMTSMYRRWPFSVSVEGSSQRAIEDAYARLVEERDVANMTVQGSGG